MSRPRAAPASYRLNLNPDELPKQTPMSQRLPLPHQTQARLPQSASCVGLPSMLQDFLASEQGHAHSQGLQGI